MLHSNKCLSNNSNNADNYFSYDATGIYLKRGRLSTPSGTQQSIVEALGVALHINTLLISRFIFTYFDIFKCHLFSMFLPFRNHYFLF